MTFPTIPSVYAEEDSYEGGAKEQYRNLAKLPQTYCRLQVKLQSDEQGMCVPEFICMLYVPANRNSAFGAYEEICMCT